MINAQSSGTITPRSIQAHQPTIGGFVEWIVAQQSLRHIDSQIVVVLSFEQDDQSFQGSQKAWRKWSRSGRIHSS